MWFHVLLLPLSLATALPQGEMVVREKREPSRSYMFSGWLPGSGMSTFASTGDMYPRGPSRRPQEHWGVDSEEQPPPPQAAASPGTLPDSAWRHEDEPDKDEREVGGVEEPVAVTRPPRKHKKKYSPKQSEGDEEEYERPSRGGSGGNAAASFNAWFPIMLGMFPPGGEMTGSGSGSGGGWRGGQGGSGGSSRGRDTHTTVIANSVSHGAHGIATSHAQVNAGPDQQRSFSS